MERIYHVQAYSFGDGEMKSYIFKRFPSKKEKMNRYSHEGNLNAEDHTAGLNKNGTWSSFKHVPNKRDWTNDQRIAREIRAAIEEEESVPEDEAEGIDIHVDEGIATLNGAVSSREERMAIEDKVSEIVGADKVVNQLNVSSPEGTS